MHNVALLNCGASSKNSNMYNLCIYLFLVIADIRYANCWENWLLHSHQVQFFFEDISGFITVCHWSESSDFDHFLPSRRVRITKYLICSSWMNYVLSPTKTTKLNVVFM